MRFVYILRCNRIGRIPARSNAPWRSLRAPRPWLVRQHSTASPVDSNAEAPAIRLREENTGTKSRDKNSLHQSSPLASPEQTGTQDAKSATAIDQSSSRDEKPEHGSLAGVARHLGLQRPMDPRLDQNPHKELLMNTKAAFSRGKDYKGVNLDCKEQGIENSIQENDYPWALKPEAWPEAGLDRLALEIAKFDAYAKSDRSEYRARRNVIKRLREDVSKALPPTDTLDAYGPNKTGLASPLSNISLAITERFTEDKYPRSWTGRSPHGRHLLEQILEHAQNKGWEYNAQLIHSSLPRLDLKHELSGLYVSISLSQNYGFARDTMVMQYLKKYPCIQQVYRVVQTMLDIRGLTSVWLGGIAPYQLFMMLAASFQFRPHSRNDAAGALYNFLDFWKDFDCSKGLSLDPPKIFKKPKNFRHALPHNYRKQKARPPYMLYFRDPVDRAADLGVAIYAIKHVQATFQHVITQLADDLDINNRGSLLAPLVGASYMLDRDRRARLHQFGKTISADQGSTGLRIRQVKI